ncbi:hypothetical protein HDU67_005091 [Dinochytrium kinnereticum]|nr:hypothetical protein HDU67_005091 [Dinochytrium kinnereticum]
MRKTSSLLPPPTRFSTSQEPPPATSPPSLPPKKFQTYATTPIAPTSVKIYVFPTIHPTKYAFHVRFSPPRNQFERLAIVLGFVLRKWRYKVSDAFAEPWTGFGKWAVTEGGFFGKLVYQGINRIITRKADDEYFLKTVPMIAEHAEFIYPPSLNSRLIKEQLVDYLGDSTKHRGKLFLWTLILPLDIYLAKVALVAANTFLCYNVFRVNAHWRANRNAQTLQRLIDTKKITWTPSQGFEDVVMKKVGEVHKEVGWRFDGGDLHDGVLERLEVELKLPELLRTYRRVRAQFLFKEWKAVVAARTGVKV